LYILQALQAPALAGACFFRRTLNEIKKQKIMYRNGSWVYMPIPLLLTKASGTVYYNNRYITTIINKGGSRMPPKTRVTAEMIIDAAVAVVRQSGFESINARTVSGQLHCSTQPVMYHFSTIDSLKRAAYRRTDRLHSEYMMNTPPGQDPILGIGLNYIRFAVEEPQLFRFLFQSGYAEENSLLEMVDSEELVPVLEAMREGAGLSLRKTRNVCESRLLNDCIVEIGPPARHEMHLMDPRPNDNVLLLC